jgi:hypothetical protein
MARGEHDVGREERPRAELVRAVLTDAQRDHPGDRRVVVVDGAAEDRRVDGAPAHVDPNVAFAGVGLGGAARRQDRDRREGHP